jgi:hypothetical protein
MATVKFSKGLVENITKSAHNKMQPAVDRALEQRPANSWGQIIYDRIFGEQIPLLKQLPSGWTQFRDSITIGAVGDQPCQLTFEFGRSLHWPHTFPANELACLTSSYRGDVKLLDDPIWDDLHLEVKAYNGRVGYAKGRQTEFVQSVTKLLEAYSTLAPALKAWPPLWELVSEDVKEQHRSLSSRTKKEIEVNVDLARLTAMSTAAKFGA